MEAKGATKLRERRSHSGIPVVLGIAGLFALVFAAIFVAHRHGGPGLSWSFCREALAQDHDHEAHQPARGKAQSKKHDDEKHEGEGDDDHEDVEDHEGDKEDEHEGHDDHEGHGDEGGNVVRVDRAKLKQLGIEIGVAGPGKLDRQATLPGRVRANENHTTHVVPRAGGVVRKVCKNVGDTVKEGEVLAILDSREVGEAALEHMSAHIDHDLAKADLDRVSMITANIRKMLDILAKETDPQKVADQLEGLKIGEAKAELLEVLTEIEVARPAYEKQKKLFEWQEALYEATSEMIADLKGVTSSEEAAKKIAGLRVGEAKAEVLEALTTRELAQLALVKAEKLFQFREPIYRNTLKMLEVFKAGISAAEARQKIKDLNIGDAKRDLIEALASVELAEANFQRQQQLLQKSVGSRKAMQEAQKELDVSASGYDSLIEQVRLSAEQEFLEAQQEYLAAKQERLAAETTYPALLEQIGVSSQAEYLEQEKELLAALGEWLTAKSSYVAKMEQVAFDAEVALLSAEKAFKLAEHGLRIAEDKLLILGLSHDQIERLAADGAERLTHLSITAPFDGSVMERHIALGEVIGEGADTFVIADLSTVWVDLSVYQKDLPYVKKGQSVVVSAGVGIADVTGGLTYVSPNVDETTRTALARIELRNPDGNWRPGLFVTAQVRVGAATVAVLIPKAAVQQLDEEPVVFIETGKGFEPKPIQTGRANTTHVEILKGLSAGERYVVKGSFALKAQIVTSGLDPHAGHGH